MPKHPDAAGSFQDLESEDIQLPAIVARNERTVQAKFWDKIRKVLSWTPFAEEAVAAYYCAFDPQTPSRVKAILLAALAYFIMPIDVLPDFVVGLGFTDDVTVVATAIGLISAHMKPEHIARAQETLKRMREDGEGQPGPKVT